MPAKPFDLEANHPLCPNPLVIKEHEKVKFPYEESIQDRAYAKWYAISKGRPVEQEVSQIYRVSKPGRGEYLLWTLILRGSDWKGNPTDFSLLTGKYEKPIFRLEKNPETQEIKTDQVTSHQTIYTTEYTSAKLNDLLEMAVEPISLVAVAPSGKRFGILSIEDFKNGTIDDLIQSASRGRPVETIVAERERNEFRTTTDQIKQQPRINTTTRAKQPPATATTTTATTTTT